MVSVSVFSLLPLLMLLPATSAAFFLPVPVSVPVPVPVPVTNPIMVHPSDLCPLVHIVEHELCATNQYNGSGSPIPELCALLQGYNASFCSSATAATNRHVSDDALSVRILQKEFHANKSNEHNEHNDIHKLCPILNFMEQELCSSPRKEPEEFDPKQLCPLLNLTYIELCN